MIKSWEDYAFGILTETPGLYQVPKLRNFHVPQCVFRVFREGQGVGGWDRQKCFLGKLRAHFVTFTNINILYL